MVNIVVVIWIFILILGILSIHRFSKILRHLQKNYGSKIKAYQKLSSYGSIVVNPNNQIRMAFLSSKILFTRKFDLDPTLEGDNFLFRLMGFILFALVILFIVLGFSL